MKKSIIILLALVFAGGINAQMRHRDFKNPGQVDTVTVSGTVIVENADVHAMYYLDIDADAKADYHLNFGPDWYKPDSATVTRPADGESVEITGILKSADQSRMDEETIIVTAINGEFWREIFRSNWNDMGKDRGHKGRGMGMNHDSLETVTLSGTTLIDTTFYMDIYYLDVDGDATPDYHLNFGPPWYTPDSGAEKPADGQSITVEGGKMDTFMDLPVVIVFTLDGAVWRDTAGLGDHMGGGWIRKDISDKKKIHSPFDKGDNVTFHKGWGGGNSGGMGGNGGGMGGNGKGTPDSIYCSVMEVLPEEVEHADGMNVIAAYYVEIQDPDGGSLMSGGMKGGKMRLGANADFNFHYTDVQMNYNKGDEKTIMAKYWDDADNSWKAVNAAVNTNDNTVSFSSDDVSNYVVLTASKVTSVNSEDELAPESFVLSQNYPNPFNPATKISFSLPSNEFVTLKVYNLLGEVVSELVNNELASGIHEVNFDASNLSSGIYFYELRAGSQVAVKKMNLMK